MCCVSCVGLKSHLHKRIPTLRHFFGIAFTSKILLMLAIALFAYNCFDSFCLVAFA